MWYIYKSYKGERLAAAHLYYKHICVCPLGEPISIRNPNYVHKKQGYKTDAKAMSDWLTLTQIF